MQNNDVHHALLEIVDLLVEYGAFLSSISKATAEAAQGSEAPAASAEEHLPEGKSNQIVSLGGNDEA